MAEGVLAEVVSAFSGGAVLTGWALHVGAGALVAGLVVGLPQMAQLLQLPAAWTTSWLGHRRACLWLVGLSRQVMLPLALLPFVPLARGSQQTLLLTVATASAVLGVLGNNAWVAWMGELVPKRVRGRYFGRRSGLCMLGGSLAAGAAGLVLDGARAHALVGPALATLQLASCVAGGVTVLLLRRQHDPAPTDDLRPVRFADALAPLRDPGARGLLAYQLAWNLAVGVGGSFFSLHMLQNLRMGFALVAVHGTVLAGVRMLAAPAWGRLVDRFGGRPVLALCSFGIAAIPFTWLLPTPERLWPLAFDAILTGALWSGQTLAVFALPLALAPRDKRPYYVAAFSSASGVAFTVGTALGGALAAALPDRMLVLGAPLYDLQILFCVSGSLRAMAAFLALRLREPAAAGLATVWAAVVGPGRRHAVAKRL
jgi:MFS family permease